ncbi:minichromosome maintenance protein MCM [Archaeoglobus sulfaticallidus]|nr:minichromosome maintenance protein MCM [Archaeoglobus sulfaticallidus]
MFSSPEAWREFFETYYQKELNTLADKILTDGRKEKSIYVNFLKDLFIFYEGRIAEELLEYPDTVLEHASKGLELSYNIHDVRLENCKARIVNLPQTRRILIRDLRSEHVSKFVAVEGIVRKVTEVRPKIVKASFICLSCGNEVFVVQDDNQLKQPYECKTCNTRGRFVFNPDNSIKVDSQRIKIQEYPENLRGGEQPQTIDVFLEGDLTGKINPGDRVVINGIVRARTRGYGSRKTPYMDIFIEGNSIEVLQQEYEEFEITQEDIEKIMELSEDPDLYKKITDSVAPVIYGYDKIKLAIALQLFGGVPKKLPDGTEIRGDIHILLVGDPGVAKSQMLRYVHRIAPRSVYTTGKGTTSAGLTATATRDEVDGRWTLEAGALVLADKGIALVDEIDKMRAEDRSALHEAMEQQTISVAKAGINAMLRSRCALLGAANPKYGRFDLYSPLVEQIDLSPTLLSRFDLIFIMTDQPNPDHDRRLAEHILKTHQIGEKLEMMKHLSIEAAEYRNEYKNIEPKIDPQLLRKYIAYAKRTVFPVLTKDAMDRIIEYYVNLRNSSKESSVTITARQLEALIRLAEASARLRLSDEVTVEDVNRVIDVVEASLKQIATNPETGEIDIDYGLTGTSKTQRDRILTIKKIVEELEKLDDYRKGVPEDEIIKRAVEKGIDEMRAKDVLHKLREKGELYSPRPNLYRIVHYT